VAARRPEVAYFEASPSTINAGGCSTLSWGVDYAAAVYLDGEGVGDHDTRQVCPPTTTAYTLYATSAGGEDTRTVTVTVIEAATATPIVDTAPPDVSGLDADPDSITANGECSGKQTTVSVNVSDPSGVAGVVAYWTLESQSGQRNMTPQSGGVYQVVLGPFSISAAPANLAISVVARDMVGNSTSPVGPVNVSVSYCIG
jgi:hypothetical protein